MELATLPVSAILLAKQILPNLENRPEEVVYQKQHNSIPYDVSTSSLPSCPTWDGIHIYSTLHSKKSRVDRIDTHLRHTNPTTLRVESTRDFLLCNTSVYIRKPADKSEALFRRLNNLPNLSQWYKQSIKLHSKNTSPDSISYIQNYPFQSDG
jgi:hypothetical protein